MKRVVLAGLTVPLMACGREPTAARPFCTAANAWRVETTYVVGTRTVLGELFQCR